MTGEEIAKVWFTVGGLFVILITMIIGGMELDKYQNVQEMKQCVASGKNWKVENIDSVNERVCVNP